MRNKKLFFLYLLMILCTMEDTNAQAVFIRQLGKVVFTSSTTDKDSLHKRAYAELCNVYINKYYHEKKLPLIYISVNSKTNFTLYELANDNLNGNSLKNKLYNKDGKYNTPGIRIVLYSQNLQQESCLKLLDYAINNLSELKFIRKQALKKDYYNQPSSLSLNKEKIDSIIHCKPKKEINDELSRLPG